MHGLRSTDVEAATKKPGQRFTWQQIVGLIVYFILAVPLAAGAVGDDPESPVSAFVLPVLYLAIVGSINWAARGRKQGRSWLDSTLSLGPYAISLAVIAISAVGNS